jgi:hypothetical protein
MPRNPEHDVRHLVHATGVHLYTWVIEEGGGDRPGAVLPAEVAGQGAVPDPGNLDERRIS